MWWFVFLAIVVLLAAWLAWRVRGEIRALVAFTRAVVAEPELPPQPGPAVWGLRRLQGAVTRMAEAVHQRLAGARAEQRWLEAVLSGMVEGVLVVDTDGVVQLSNPRVQELLQLPPGEDCVGRPLIELTRHPDLHELVRQAMLENAAGRSLVREMALDGAGQLTVRVTATPLTGADEAVRAYILVFHDVSELKRLERMRRDFVANVSHELRTPLTAIKGYSETLLTSALDDAEAARRFVGIIDRHAERLSRLVDDLLTLSDLELGRTALQRAAVEADDVIGHVVEIMRGKAEKAKITIVCDSAPGLPALHADPDRLEQALLNLVDNAIKFTPAGGQVTVTARAGDTAKPGLETGTDTGVHVQLAVADTGIGIPSRDLPRLAERFYRVDKARSRELGGTGLGLAIVKHIVQAHGGWMRIESELNRGTTVYLNLPALPSPQSHPPLAARSSS